jgi:hypothetical protein
MKPAKRPKAEVYVRYPASSVAIYNGSTILHFMLGSAGIIVGYAFSPWPAFIGGFLYLALALLEMYVVMPLAVCPHCTYYRIKDSLCVSGLNLFARKIAEKGNAKDFPKRAVGLFCPNNLYMASLIVPIVAMAPAMAINFSALLLAIFLATVALLAFRFFVIFPVIACLHCKAKAVCPQAGAMGVRDK